MSLQTYLVYIAAHLGHTLLYMLQRYLSLEILCTYTYSDWLRFGRPGDRIQVGARFSAPVQTVSGPHSAPVQWVPGLSQR